MKGRIRDEDITIVRERNNIVDVVSDYVSLKKKGKLYWGLCPFHQEKTPSFKADPVSQLYHCFGCGEGGNVFGFIMKVEHLEFPEAVESLAERIGYTLTFEKQYGPEQSKRARIFEANRLTMLYYQYVLHKTKEGERGRFYLKKRGLRDDIVKRYGLGLAPQSWSSLGNYLVKKGFSREELVQAGIMIKGQKGFYDRFRGRLIFPITDTRGRAVAFGGRVLGTGEPKYLNSPETPVYHKSSLLYGLNNAKGDVVRDGAVIVVEGYTDVLALAQAGITNVVATLGTAFTHEHVELLKRFAERVVLVFDADAAGIKAAESASSYLSEFRLPKMEALKDLEQNAAGIDVRVVILPNKQDPADFIGANNINDFRVLIDNAEPFFDFYLTRELDKHNISEIRQKEHAALAGFKLIATLDNPASQKAYLSKIAQHLEFDEEALTVKFNATYKRKMSTRVEAKATMLNPQQKAERSFLQLAIQYPEVRAKIPAEMDESYFVASAHGRLFTVLKEMGGGKFDAGTLESLDTKLASYATQLLLADSECEEEKLSKFFEDILVSLKDFHYKRQINKIKRELESTQVQQSKGYYDELFEELIALEAKRRDLR
ncbi:MAG TPA: DNA primase [Candidatus Aquicultor sp.]|jgi:DNA primase